MPRFLERFYATRDDLSGGIGVIEHLIDIKYVLTGMFASSRVQEYSSANELPNLGLAPTGNHLLEPRYIALPVDASIASKPIPQRNGGLLFAIDPRDIESSLIFHPGGLFAENVLISGEFGIAHEDSLSKHLFDTFVLNVFGKFKKIKGIYMGPESLKILAGGGRLTDDIKRPKIYDLAISEELLASDRISKTTNGASHKRNYEESCQELQRLGYIEKDQIPPLPLQRPKYDDGNPLGVRFVRMLVADAVFEGLTLPRTFFGRSEINRVSFKESDLPESTLCWNDFIAVDFSDCNLSRSDLRASNFREVKFIRTNFSQADLRRSTFRDCDFADANFEKAKLTRDQTPQLRLSPAQMQAVDWQDSIGEEPGGG